MNNNINNKKYQLESYKKYLLNRVSATPHFVEYIENCLASEDEAAQHSFHKIMVHNWQGSESSLFEVLTEYFSPSFVPVNCTSQGVITTFYTSSLSLVAKITKLDFMFPHQRNMYNIDILFNDKSSADCFENRVTIDDIVAGVVSNRFSEKFELNLANFCNDPEFQQKKIHFYKVNLLSNFKILMLRMGRDTKSLDLSNNRLSTVPIDILNFFIKGDLIAINLSNNNIPSLQELHRVSSKIEKLWLEGNPLCEELDPSSYVKQITMKFPRLNELDGIRLNEHGVPLPLFKNFVENPDRRTKMIVDKFLSLYFSHYDHERKNIHKFYDEKATLTMSNRFTADEERCESMTPYANSSRNFLNHKKKLILQNPQNPKKHIYRGQTSIGGALSNLPHCIHDPTTFTVDVMFHNRGFLMLVVEGVFKETKLPERILHFRRTFIFGIKTNKLLNSQYWIINEMFTLSFPTKEVIENSFKNSIPSNMMCLRNPDHEDVSSMCYVFTHITQLKKPEAERRLKQNDYDIRAAVKEFQRDFKANKISADQFIEEDDFSDTSSLIDDELD